MTTSSTTHSLPVADTGVAIHVAAAANLVGLAPFEMRRMGRQGDLHRADRRPSGPQLDRLVTGPHGRRLAALMREARS